MPTETFDDPQAFLDALHGKKRSAKKARQSRPDVPRAGRAAAGEGDRQGDLNRLAARGWTGTNYLHSTGLHWMTNQAGISGPSFPTYRAMLDGYLQG